MHRIIKRPWAAATLVWLVAGCAGTPDCGDSLARADSAAAARQPLATWIDEVRPECRADAQERWQEILAGECAPLYGFHSGYTGHAPADQCRSSAFVEARNLGELLGDITREQARIEATLASSELADRERAQLRQRLIVIERDRPQIAALARMQGYLPPAVVPEANDN